MVSESNFVSVIFNNMEIKIREALEIATKFNIKTLCTLFLFFASKILENIAVKTKIY